MTERRLIYSNWNWTTCSCSTCVWIIPDAIIAQRLIWGAKKRKLHGESQTIALLGSAAQKSSNFIRKFQKSQKILKIIHFPMSWAGLVLTQKYLQKKRANYAKFVNWAYSAYWKTLKTTTSSKTLIIHGFIGKISSRNRLQCPCNWKTKTRRQADMKVPDT